MKQYGEYKDSGIQWIGEIPSHWTPIAMSFYFYMKGRIGWQGLKADEFTDKGPYLVTGTDFENGRVVWERCYHISEERYNEAPEIHVQEGDLLITKDGTVGKLALIENKPEKVSLNSHLLILRPTSPLIDNHFVYWALQAENFEYYTGLTQNGSIMASLSQDKIGDYKFALPSLPEQRAIASYLDYKVGQIDAAIKEKELLLDDLKAYRSAIISEAVTKGLDRNVEMKNSGVEWIGEIPRHWQLTKLKSKAKVNGRIGFRGYSTADLVSAGEGAYTIGGKHITNCVLDLSEPDFISWDKYYESPEIMVNKGDILMAQRGSLGKAALVRDEIGKATINPSLVLLNKIKMNNVFLYYFLVSNSCLAYIDLLNTATAVPMISQNQIENIFITIPPDKEQAEIVYYLDRKTKDIDSSSVLVNEELAELKSYKSSLITEAVTGKVDLRDWKKQKEAV